MFFGLWNFMSERSEAKSRKHAKTILPLIRFSTQCETSRRNGATTGRFRKASVRHAPTFDTDRHSEVYLDAEGVRLVT